MGFPLFALGVSINLPVLLALVVGWAEGCITGKCQEKAEGKANDLLANFKPLLLKKTTSLINVIITV